MLPFNPKLVAALILASLFTSGCGVVHFGRLPSVVVHSPDASEQKDEITALRSQRVMLQRELSLSQLEGATLRTIVETPKGAMTTERMAALDANLKEITRLREEHLALQAEYRRVFGVTAGDEALKAEVQAKMAASDDRLAAAMYTFTSLRRENESLRNEVRLVRGQNARLSDQVQKLAQQKYALERELAAVNGPLYAEKKAHDEALRVFASKPNEGGRIAFKAGLFARPE